MAPSRNLLQEQPTSYHARPERENPRPRVALDFDFGHPNARKPQSCAFTQIANWGNAGMAPARGRIPARRSKSSATFGRPTSLTGSTPSRDRGAFAIRRSSPAPASRPPSSRPLFVHYLQTLYKLEQIFTIALALAKNVRPSLLNRYTYRITRGTPAPKPAGPRRGSRARRQWQGRATAPRAGGAAKRKGGTTIGAAAALRREHEPDQKRIRRADRTLARRRAHAARYRGKGASFARLREQGIPEPLRTGACVQHARDARRLAGARALPRGKRRDHGGRAVLALRAAFLRAPQGRAQSARRGARRAADTPAARRRASRTSPWWSAT